MSPRLERLTDALADELVPVPGDANDVCPMCRSWRPPGRHRCDNCDQVLDELSAPCELVVPISLYSKPSPMRDRLTYYKDGELDLPDRRRYGLEVAAILDRFFAEHGDSLEALTGGWEAACVVPSESRPTPHPLEVALDELPAIHVPTRKVLLERDIGEVGHRVLSDNAYRTRMKVAGRAVLVLDDVYTTGGRAQSAASALALAGAHVVGVVVVARRMNPDWKPGVRALWDRQVQQPFSFADQPWWTKA